MASPAFHGLIQHSFPLRLAKERRPFAGPGNLLQVHERFVPPASGGVAFKVRSMDEPAIADRDGKTRAADIAEHSPLVRSGQTTVRPLPIGFSLAAGGFSDPSLPPAFRWAGKGRRRIDPNQDGPTFIFGGNSPETGKVERNDYLVERSGCGAETQPISSSLLEIFAHKRSRLLGLALANRIVSVMLPHAILTPGANAKSSGRSGGSDGSWFVQPLVSFIRDGRVKTEFRDSYSLTLLLVPIKTPAYEDRKMTPKEIDWAVNAGWGLAAVPSRKAPPRYKPSGPLVDYLPRLVAPYDLGTMLGPAPDSAAGARAEEGALTLRQGTEALAFCLGLRLAQGSAGRATEQTKRRIGDDVVTSLGSARVSSVLVVDEELTVDGIREEEAVSLKHHQSLMAKLSRETRPPSKPRGYEKFRLDRPFVDDDTYVVGMVPTRRCVVVSCAAEAQHGWYQSGLMQVGSLGHMTIGAATAIGTLRAIDRDLEELEAADPSKIAAIDGEIATDLREIYDLDITDEAYRRLYRLLRKRLGITRDYRALEEKMLALYRATSTRHDVKAQRQLKLLTVAIVGLSVLILIVGIAAIFVSRR